MNRATGLLIIEVVNSNPNGDPDRESDPRQRANGQGEISPVSFKRKLRDLVEFREEGSVFCNIAAQLQLNSDCFQILESRGRDRKAINGKFGDAKTNEAFLASQFVKDYWDGRLFGNTFLEEEGDKCTIKTGVVQFGMGLSICPINIQRQTNTNKSGVQEGKNQGMAPLAYRVVEHGVYVMPFFVNPTMAARSGCTDKDIDLMKALIPYAYDHTRSAIRPDVRLRHAWFIEHKNPLGSCPDHLLIDALMPTVKEGKSILDPSTSWTDYTTPNKLPDNLNAKIEKCTDLMNF
jgi:CRISPR-associated protein Csd2